MKLVLNKLLLRDKCVFRRRVQEELWKVRQRWQRIHNGQWSWRPALWNLWIPSTRRRNTKYLTILLTFQCLWTSLTSTKTAAFHGRSFKHRWVVFVTKWMAKQNQPKNTLHSTKWRLTDSSTSVWVMRCKTSIRTQWLSTRVWASIIKTLLTKKLPSNLNTQSISVQKPSMQRKWSRRGYTSLEMKKNMRLEIIY